MSDYLRTRIAKALYGQITAPVPLFDDQSDEVQSAWLADADAVIRELGLREERRGPVTAYRDGQYYPDSSLVRFISDWETRDD
jgi:hypothetical protein